MSAVTRTPVGMPHHLPPNVHQEHLPAGRYSAAGRGGVFVDPASHSHAVGASAVHHAGKVYHLVASGLFEMEATLNSKP